MVKKENKYKEKLVSIITIITAIVVFTILAGLIIKFFPFGKKELFEYFHLSVHKIVYLVAGVFVPISILLTNFVLMKNLRVEKNNKLVYRILLGLSLALLIFFIIHIDFSLFYVWIPDKLKTYKSISTIILTAIFSSLIFFTFNEKSLLNKLLKGNSKYIYIVIFFIAIYMAQLALINDEHRYNANALNLSPVMHPVVQVFYGNSTLIEIKTQYGLYAQLLEPIFILIGDITVFSFSVVMATLLFSTLFLNGSFLLKVLNNKILALTAFIAYIFFHFFAGTLWPYELYYQYYPIRTIFPAISLFLSYIYFKNKSQTKYLTILFVLSVGVIWNMDVGLFAFLAFVSAETYSKFFDNVSVKQNIKSILLSWLQAILVFVFTFILFFLYLKFRYHQWPIISEIWSSYKIFFGKTPFSINRLWTIVILIYFSGLYSSVKYLYHKKNRLVATLLFFTTLLGLGIFTYHLNKTHDAVLTNCTYPAIFVLAILSDQLKYKNKFTKWLGYMYDHSMTLLSIILISFLAAAFLLNFKNSQILRDHLTLLEMKFPDPQSQKVLWDIKNADNTGTSWIRLSDYVNGYDPKLRASWLQKSDYVSKFAKKDGSIRDDIFIMSNWDYLLYQKARARTPLFAVNFRHLFLDEEWEMIYDQIKNKESKYILVDEEWGLFKGDFKNHKNHYIDKLTELIDENYNEIERTNQGYGWYIDKWYENDMVLYQRK